MILTFAAVSQHFKGVMTMTHYKQLPLRFPPENKIHTTPIHSVKSRMMPMMNTDAYRKWSKYRKMVAATRGSIANLSNAPLADVQAARRLHDACNTITNLYPLLQYWQGKLDDNG